MWDSYCLIIVFFLNVIIRFYFVFRVIVKEIFVVIIIVV